MNKEGSDIKRSKYIFLIIGICITLFPGCSLIKSLQSDSNKTVNKYYIGRANTETFQQVVEKVLLEYNYHIEEYDNGPTSSFLVTRWKIRETEEFEAENKYEESKTKLIITGMIDNQSFERNNGFSYECFLEVRNFIYDGNTFVPDYKNIQLNNEINEIVNKFIQTFANMD